MGNEQKNTPTDQEIKQLQAVSQIIDLFKENKEFVLWIRNNKAQFDKMGRDMQPAITGTIISSIGDFGRGILRWYTGQFSLSLATKTKEGLEGMIDWVKTSPEYDGFPNRIKNAINEAKESFGKDWTEEDVFKQEFDRWDRTQRREPENQLGILSEISEAANEDIFLRECIKKAMEEEGFGLRDFFKDSKAKNQHNYTDF